MEKILLIDEIECIKNYIDSYSLNHIINGEIDKFEGHGEFTLLSFDWYDINDLDAFPSQINIHFNNKNLFIICENKRSYEKANELFESINTSENSIEKIVYNFFSELIKGDTNHLESLEEEITKTEDDLLTSSKKECSSEIISFRREILQLKKYYEQLNRIFEGLIQNENNIISEDSLRYFNILDSRIDRLFANVLNIRDYVTQVREAYQAQIDIEQNNLMKIFTVMTSIFMPLTLIVGWYGMNLKMPEFSWKYGYAFVIVLSISITIFSLILFKRKRWF